MRPLAIGVTCYPTFGGSGVVATELGLRLARRGHRVHFIAYDVPARLERLAGNVWFHEVEDTDYPLFHQGQYPLSLASKMVEVSRYERLDLLHVHYAIPHATSAVLAKQIIGAGAPRVVTTLHGTDITLVGADPSFLPITRFSILESDALTVPSAYLREATYANLDVPRDKRIDVVPNFVDAERFRPAPPESGGRSFAPLGGLFPRLREPAPRVVLHVSNFRPLKRVDDVVRVFARIREATSAVLVLVGDGPERSRVECLVRELGLGDAVCFLGKQLGFIEALQNADLFLLPSASESFGLAALEALSCGVPVIASDVGGLPEVIADGVTGFLAPVGDVEAMATDALCLLRDREMHARMSLAARRAVEERFRPEPATEMYEEVYERVLG